MTGAVICGSGTLWTGLVGGRRTASLAPVWGVGRASTLCTGPAAVSPLREVAQCAQFDAFRFVLTFCILAAF